MIKRKDGSYSQRGLWDNIRANRGSGKKPTKEMLKQERKIKKKSKKGGGYRSRYQAGGMYSDNTVAAAGQGMGSTANIVYQESNPAMQQQRVEFFESERDRLIQEGATTEQEVKQIEEQSKIDIQAAEQEAQQKTELMGSTVQTGIKGAQSVGLIDESAGSLGLKSAIKAYQAQRAVNLAAQSQSGIMAGVQTSQQAAAGVKSAQLAAKSGALPVGVAAEGTGMAAQTGSATQAGMSAANMANVYSLAANVGGKVIRKQFDDDDPTTWTTGEAAGDILGSAGEYAGYGTMIAGPGVGTAVGAIIGTGVGIYKGLSGRKKARKAKREAEARIKEKKEDYSLELRKRFGTSMSARRAGELKQKMYSGYDLGRNVVARKGGMRMGIPRYGYAA